MHSTCSQRTHPTRRVLRAGTIMSRMRNAEVKQQHQCAKTNYIGSQRCCLQSERMKKKIDFHFPPPPGTNSPKIEAIVWEAGYSIATFCHWQKDQQFCFCDPEKETGTARLDNLGWKKLKNQAPEVLGLNNLITATASGPPSTARRIMGKQSRDRKTTIHHNERFSCWCWCCRHCVMS